MKLRSKITGYILPLILIPIFLTAAAVYYFVVRTNEARDRVQVELRIASSIARIRQKVVETRNSVDVLVASPVLNEFLEEKPGSDQEHFDAVQQFVNKIARQDPFILDITVMNSSGNPVIQTTGSALIDLRLLEYQEQLFQRVQVVGSAQTPVLKLPEGSSVTIFANAVGKTKFLGTVSITLNTLAFRDSFRTQLMDGMSIAFFDDRGTIWSKFGNQTALSEVFKGDRASIGQENPSSERDGTKTRQLSSGLHMVSVFPILGYRRTSTVAPQEGERWYLGVVEPVTIPPGLRGFQLFLALIVLFSSFAAVWISAITARRITRPIEAVSRATVSIAKGKHELDLAVETGDEVEDLAKAVSDMNHDLQQYQQQLVESARLAAMGEMTSEISHEIQNRISGISLWLQHLDSEVPEHDERREYIDEMKLGLSGFYEMLSGLKEYYRKPALNFSEFTTGGFFAETVMFAEEEAARKSIKILTQNSDDSVKIHADREKLQSVLLNLLINAVDASPLSSKIKIVSQIDEREWCFTVEDEGPGIPVSERHKVFFPFYTTKASGSGLGLAISKNVVSAHLGSLKISDAGNGGSIFEVRIPLNRN